MSNSNETLSNDPSSTGEPSTLNSEDLGSSIIQNTSSSLHETQTDNNSPVESSQTEESSEKINSDENKGKTEKEFKEEDANDSAPNPTEGESKQGQETPQISEKFGMYLMKKHPDLFKDESSIFAVAYLRKEIHSVVSIEDAVKILVFEHEGISFEKRNLNTTEIPGDGPDPGHTVERLLFAGTANENKVLELPSMGDKYLCLFLGSPYNPALPKDSIAWEAEERYEFLPKRCEREELFRCEISLFFPPRNAKEDSAPPLPIEQDPDKQLGADDLVRVVLTLQGGEFEETGSRLKMVWHENAEVVRALGKGIGVTFRLRKPHSFLQASTAAALSRKLSRSQSGGKGAPSTGGQQSFGIPKGSATTASASGDGSGALMETFSNSAGGGTDTPLSNRSDVGDGLFQELPDLPLRPRQPKGPKNPTTSYMFWSQENFSLLAEENPNLSFGELGKLLGQKWRSMTNDEKGKSLECICLCL